MQNWLFPPVCVLCGDSGHAHLDLCPPCRADLPLNHTSCRSCGLPLTGIAGHEGVCGTCLQQPPVMQRVISPYIYEQPLAHLIQALKFRDKLHIARLLGALLAEHLASLPDLERPSAIIPVPLHSSRLRERGFNQALELAHPVARRLNIPLQQSCQRIRPTDAQMTLDAQARKRNIKGAFAVCDSRLPEHVALIDDVMTTGHTVRELTKTLQRAGVSRVQVWVCARAV